MSRNAIIGAAAILTILVALIPVEVTAQSIRGQVVLTGWREPVPAADVQLLNAELAPVTSTRTDETGAFRFGPVDPGRYFIQAIHGELFSTLEGPIELDEAAAAQAELTMRSELYDRALDCLADGQDPGTGVLAGVAYDAGTDIPIPGAGVVIEWPGERRRASRLNVAADGGGRFVACGVPAGQPVTVWVESFGRSSDREQGVQIQAGAVARLDIPLRMGTEASLRVLAARADELRTDQAATVEGRVLDAETETAIGGAEVRLNPDDRRTLTDANGRFRFANVAPGQTTFAVRRLGYEWESGMVNVPETASMVIELRAAPQAVELDAIVVRSSTSEARSARAMAHAPRVISGTRIRRAEERAASLTELIRTFPSVTVREGRYETADGIEFGYCIQTTRAMHRYEVPEQETTLPWCESIAVVVDGVITARGLEMLYALPLWEVESLEYLPPHGAIRWGLRAAMNGALVIWTRGRGPHRTADR